MRGKVSVVLKYVGVLGVKLQAGARQKGLKIIAGAKFWILNIPFCFTTIYELRALENDETIGVTKKSVRNVEQSRIKLITKTKAQAFFSPINCFMAHDVGK